MIEKKWLKAIQQEGLRMRMIRDTKDAWFFLPDANRINTLGLQPQLLIGKKQAVKKFSRKTCIL